jgi:hypothetical protein
LDQVEDEQGGHDHERDHSRNGHAGFFNAQKAKQSELGNDNADQHNGHEHEPHDTARIGRVGVVEDELMTVDAAEEHKEEAAEPIDQGTEGGINKQHHKVQEETRLDSGKVNLIHHAQGLERADSLPSLLFRQVVATEQERADSGLKERDDPEQFEQRADASRHGQQLHKVRILFGQVPGQKSNELVGIVKHGLDLFGDRTRYERYTVVRRQKKSLTKSVKG